MAGQQQVLRSEELMLSSIEALVATTAVNELVRDFEDQGIPLMIEESTRIVPRMAARVPRPAEIDDTDEWDLPSELRHQACRSATPMIELPSLPSDTDFNMSVTRDDNGVVVGFDVSDEASLAASEAVETSEWLRPARPRACAAPATEDSIEIEIDVDLDIEVERHTAAAEVIPPPGYWQATGPHPAVPSPPLPAARCPGAGGHPHDARPAGIGPWKGMLLSALGALVVGVALFCW